jgi:protein gp37
MGKTSISWTEQTWNPIVGCSIVSPGCTNCYAMKMAARIESLGGAPQYHGTTQKSRGGPVWTGKVALAEKALFAPLKRKKPTMYFVNSMGDLFHEDVPDEWIDRVFAVMALCPQHTFQVLTKRAERMRDYITRLYSKDGFLGNAVTNLRLTVFPHVMDAEDVRGKGPFPNVWLGVSAEDQTRANERIPALLDTPAAVRFVSAEPLLGPVDLIAVKGWKSDEHLWTEPLTGRAFFDDAIYPSDGAKLDWIIVGGESGPNARPMHPDWARGLRDQCQVAKVPFFFKQWGEWKLRKPKAGGDLGGKMRKGRARIVQLDRDPDGHFRKGDVMMNRIGKRAAGSLLDGRAWKEMPG